MPVMPEGRTWAHAKGNSAVQLEKAAESRVVREVNGAFSPKIGGARVGRGVVPAGPGTTLCVLASCCPWGASMSVTKFMKHPEVAAMLKRVLPPHPRRIAAPLLAAPLTRSYGTVGTAFDYALRFELGRRYPHVRLKPWVAERALRKFAEVSRDKEMQQVAAEIVAIARVECDAYVTSKFPSLEARAAVAAHAIRLAKVDAVLRAGYVDPKMNSVDPRDVEDILRLLEVVPYEKLGDPAVVWLNPTFGEYSRLVKGADCDLISGNRLIEIKVTKADGIDLDYLRQLVSYLILARGARRDDAAFPAIEAFGIYFARHGYLWTIPAESVVTNPSFSEVEAWYLAHAAETFGVQPPVGTMRGGGTNRVLVGEVPTKVTNPGAKAARCSAKPGREKLKK